MHLRCSTAFVIALAWTSACNERELTPTTTCLASRVTKVIRVGVEDKVDVLLVVDNSASMADEQVHLRQQFPNIMRALTTGARTPGDPDPFPPLRDLHMAIVSADLGVSGVELAAAGCRADGGDDGRLQHVGHGADCQTSYPAFLSFSGSRSVGPVTDVGQFAQDVLCIGELGTAGCGYEQLLEAPFKALWPKLQLDYYGDPVSRTACALLILLEGWEIRPSDAP